MKFKCIKNTVFKDALSNSIKINLFFILHLSEKYAYFILALI